MKSQLLILLGLAILPAVSQADEKPPVGFEVKFGGEAQRGSKASYDVEIIFFGVDEDDDYTNSYGVMPYSPQFSSKALAGLLNTDKIETVKIDDTTFVIVGYRAPGKKLQPVKSVKITPKDGTAADKVPNVTDTRPKA